MKLNGLLVALVFSLCICALGARSYAERIASQIATAQSAEQKPDMIVPAANPGS